MKKLCELDEATRSDNSSRICGFGGYHKQLEEKDPTLAKEKTLLSMRSKLFTEMTNHSPLAKKNLDFFLRDD